MEAGTRNWKRFRPMAEKVKKEVGVRVVHTTFTSAVKVEFLGRVHSI